MSELELKQFKIEQTEKLLVSFSDGWKIYHDSFNGLMEEIRASNWRERNPILAVCGFFASLLLGLISTNHITLQEFQIYLAIVGIVSFVVFLGYGIYIVVLMKTIRKAEQGIIQAFSNLDYFRNYFIIITIDIDKISLDKIEDLFALSTLIQISNRIMVFEELEKLTKLNRIAKDVQNSIKLTILNWEEGIQENIAQFEKIKNEFDKEEWVGFKPYVKNLIEYHAKKQNISSENKQN